MSAINPSRSELTPIAALDRVSRIFPTRTAVVHGERRYSYAQFTERVRRLAHALSRLGVGPGDRVAILSPNTPAMLEAHFAIPMAAGVIVAVNTRLSPHEVAAIVADCGAGTLLVDAEFLDAAAEVGRHVRRIVIADTGGDDDPYEQLLARSDPAPIDFAPTSEDDLIALNYTSGTTGQPKGAMYTHRGAYLESVGVIIETGLSYGSVYLWTLPMFHCNGWCFPWAVTAVGGTHVCARGVDPALIWAQLTAERVTHLCGAPTVLISLVNHPAATRLDQQLHVALGGASPSPTLVASMVDLNLEPAQLYGLTEVYGPHVTCVPQPEWQQLPADRQAALRARQGHVFLAGEQVRVQQTDGSEVAFDAVSVGEVLMRGNTVMAGYHGQPQLTEEAFEGGWFHTGDLAVVHPDGYLEIVDRAKDIIISGGENISTIEVERTISSHPAVLDVAVVAMPDEKWGERPKAFVTLRGGAHATESEIIEHCREHLAHFKAPAQVEFGPLPKTSTGKTQKALLRRRSPDPGHATTRAGHEGGAASVSR